MTEIKRIPFGAQTLSVFPQTVFNAALAATTNNEQKSPKFPASEKIDAKYIANKIAAFVPSVVDKGETTELGSGVISMQDLEALADTYGEAWNVKNYLPSRRAYNISDVAEAIIKTFDRADDHTQVVGCNGKCDIPNFGLCQDGVLSREECELAQIKGEYLFDMGPKPKTVPTPKTKGDEQINTYG